MKDLTQGSIGRHIGTMSLTMAAGMLLQTLYFIVDLYFIAGLGDAAIAGVSTAGTVVFIVVAVTQALGVGTVALVSQAVGRKDREAANHIFNQSVALAALCTAATLVTGYALAPAFMRLFSTDAATLAAGTTFLYWFIPNLALQFPMVVMASGLRGTGIVKPAMIVQAITVLMNAALAPVLIAGWGTGHPMGVAGGGLASSLSLAVGVFAVAIYFARLEKYVAFDPAQWRPRLATWKRMLAIGLPAGGEFFLMTIFSGIMYWAIRDHGTAAQAGLGVGLRINQAAFVPAMAISLAAAPIAGQNFGAGRHERVRETFRSSVLWSCVVMLSITAFVQCNQEAMLRAFTQEAEVVAVGSEFMRIVSWNFAAVGVIFCCSSLFQALGNTWPSLVSSAVRLVAFAIPVVWISKQDGFQIAWIWYVSVATVLLQLALSLAFVRQQFGRRLEPRS